MMPGFLGVRGICTCLRCAALFCATLLRAAHGSGVMPRVLLGRLRLQLPITLNFLGPSPLRRNRPRVFVVLGRRLRSGLLMRSGRRVGYGYGCVCGIGKCRSGCGVWLLRWLRPWVCAGAGIGRLVNDAVVWRAVCRVARFLSGIASIAGPLLSSGLLLLVGPFPVIWLVLAAMVAAGAGLALIAEISPVVYFARDFPPAPMNRVIGVLLPIRGACPVLLGLRRHMSADMDGESGGSQTGLGQSDLLLDLGEPFAAHTRGRLDLLAVGSDRRRRDHRVRAENLTHSREHDLRRFMAAMRFVGGNGQREGVLAQRAVEGHRYALLARTIRGQRDAYDLVPRDVFANIGRQRGNGEKLYGVVQKVVVGGFDPRRFVEDLLSRVRDLLVLTLGGERAESVLGDDSAAEDMDHLHRQAAALGLGSLSAMAETINAALSAMAGAVSPRMQLELLAARLLAGRDPETAVMAAQQDSTANMAGIASGQSAGGAAQSASQGGFAGSNRRSAQRSSSGAAPATAPALADQVNNAPAAAGTAAEAQSADSANAMASNPGERSGSMPVAEAQPTSHTGRNAPNGRNPVAAGDEAEAEAASFAQTPNTGLSTTGPSTANPSPSPSSAQATQSAGPIAA